MLYGGRSGSPKGTQRWEGLRKEAEDAKDKLGVIPLSVEEIAILRLLHFWL